MNNGNNQYNYGQLSDTQKYGRARVSLLVLFMLSFANVFFIMVGNFNFGLSSYISTFVTLFFKSMSENPLYFALGIIVGIICTAPLLVTYIVSKKNTLWICFGFYWVCLDSLLLFADFTLIIMQNPVGATSYIADLAFHAWIVYALVNGVKVRNYIDDEENQDNN